MRVLTGPFSWTLPWSPRASLGVSTGLQGSTGTGE